MIQKAPLEPNRIRTISGSFAWIPHRFLRGGFFASLTRDQLLLYLFLVLVGDRKGLSYYGYDKICTLLGISVDNYILARDGLIEKDLIAFDGLMFQVLALPEAPGKAESRPLKTPADMLRHDPATIGQVIRRNFGA